MSGPKVIHTVTIEQLREEARVQLALVAESMRLWQGAATGSEESTASRLGRLIEEQNRIEVALQADRFSDVTTRSQAVVAAIRQDIQRLHEEQDARNARSRVQERSLRQTAKTVLERCLRTGLAISKDHQEKLEAVAKGQAFDVQEIATIVAGWLEEVSGSDHQRETDAQEALARSLSGSSRESAAGELLNRLEAEFADPRIAAAEKQMAELARLGEQQAAEQFGQTLSTIVSSEPRSKSITRGLAFDSLGLELSRAVKLARRRAELLTDLASELAAATATNDLKACQQAILDAERALETRDLEQGRAHIERIRVIRETCQRARAANAARQTILSGLKKLGYEVREGMLTMWADKKRLAIRHPDKPGVALELAGTGDSGRMQTRMVAVEGAARDSRSDKQVEEEWCGNLKSLQEAVANAGGTVQIEKALAPGIQPLKVIPDEWQDVVTTIHKPREHERST
jgi:hypothetical protein